MTQIELKPNEAAAIVRADGSVELMLPTPDDAKAEDSHVIATMMVWATQQPDIRERFEAILALQ